MPETGRQADTTAEASRFQTAAWRRMSPEQRLALVCELSESFRRVIADGVRYRHPEYDERSVQLAVRRIQWGDGLFREVYPGVDVAP